MTRPNEPEYLDAKLVKQEKKVLTFPFDELAAWISQRYRVTVLNIFYDVLDEGTVPRLNVILEYERDRDKFIALPWPNFRKDRQEAVAAKWRALLGHDRWLVFPTLRKRPCNDTFRSDKLFVIFTSFDYAAKVEANQAIPKEELDDLRDRIDADAKTLWRIEPWEWGAVFFFYTDREARRFGARKLHQELNEAYFRLLEPYDEFGYFDRDNFKVRLSSKEHLNKKCDGSFYRFFQ